MEKYPNNLGLIVRKEFTDLRDSTIKDFEDLTGYKVGSDKDVRLPNGSRIMFRHGSELNTLQNINLGACGIEQGDEFDDDSQWFMLFGRMRRKNCGKPSLFLIANANGDDWVNKLWGSKDHPEIKPAPGYELYEATTFDNSDILPESFMVNLQTLKLQKPSVYEQYVMNSRKVVSGKIYPMLNNDYHVIEDQDLPDWWERIGIIDTAVASGVCHAGLYAISPEGDIIKYNEYHEKERLISDHCERINKIVGNDRISYWQFDPSAFNKTREKMGRLYSVADELRDYGIVGNPAENDVDAGINRLGEYLKIDHSRQHPYRNLLGSPKFFYMQRCKESIREIFKYREVPNKLTNRGDGKWMPYKHDDHGCFSAGTKILMGDGSLKNIEDIHIGDLVQTANGTHKVLNQWCTGIKTVYKIKFSNGKYLIGTGDHPIYTTKGKRSLDTIRYNDKIYSWNQSFSKHKDTIGMENITPQLVDASMVVKDYMLQYGRVLTEQLQRACAYITSMVSAMITRYQICPAFQSAIIAPTTQETTCLDRILKIETILYSQLLELKRQNGISQKKEEDGIKHTLKKFGRIIFPQSKYAHYATKNIKGIQKDYIVQTNVNPQADGNQRKIMRQEVAKFVRRHLLLINTTKQKLVRMIARESLDQEIPVYNLTIEEDHNYYANSILVSNCDADRYAVMSRPSSPTEPKEEIKMYTAAWYLEKYKREQMVNN